jgi:hypothetical protein
MTLLLMKFVYWNSKTQSMRYIFSKHDLLQVNKLVFVRMTCNLPVSKMDSKHDLL